MKGSEKMPKDKVKVGIIGFGEIDWQTFVSVLQEEGYDGVVSIEHEDPIWSGTEEKVKKGLILGYRHLSPFII